jgi:hypothetical protein
MEGLGLTLLLQRIASRRLPLLAIDLLHIRERREGGSHSPGPPTQQRAGWPVRSDRALSVTRRSRSCHDFTPFQPCHSSAIASNIGQGEPFRYVEADARAWKTGVDTETSKSNSTSGRYLAFTSNRRTDPSCGDLNSTSVIGGF